MIIKQEVQYPFRRFEKIVEMAKALIEKPIGREKHLAFAMKGSRVITVGFNNVFTERVKIDHKYYLSYPHGGVHAELDCVANLGDLSQARKLTLVSLRVNKLGQLRYAKPCPTCQNYLRRIGFRAVYYSLDNGFVRL